MATLSAAQIAGVIKTQQKMGGASGLVNPNTDGPIMVAIALAESSGNTDAIGGPNSNGSHDYGLWQINDKAHPLLFNNHNWKDPNDNFFMAQGIYQDAGFRWKPWSTFNNGAYQAHMADAVKAWGNPDTSLATSNPVQDTATAVGNAVDAIGSTAAFISALQNPQTWIRVGMAASGLVLVLIAVWPAVKGSVGGVASLTPVGRAAKIAGEAAAK